MKARLAFAALALVAGTAGAQQQPATGGAAGSTGSAMGSSMQDSSAMKSGMKKHSSKKRSRSAKKKAMTGDSASMMKKPS